MEPDELTSIVLDGKRIVITEMFEQPCTEHEVYRDLIFFDIDWLRPIYLNYTIDS